MSIRKRFIDSIEFLRKMDFFKKYSNLTSEEIFEKMKKEYHIDLRRWIKRSTFEIDRYLATEDEDRIWIQDTETLLDKGVEIEFLNNLARISRGVFQPTYIRSEWSEKDNYTKCRVYFNYMNKEDFIDFIWDYDFLDISHAINKINEMIKNTGYQYYEIQIDDQRMLLTVLTNEEVKKLKERGWKIIEKFEPFAFF
ncbi:MAG: hypothetical protein QXW69_03015 [Nitrososphaerota archaeon]